MLGTLRLSQPTCFGGIVCVGWVKPPAAYPATPKAMTGWKALVNVINSINIIPLNLFRASHAKHRDTGKTGLLSHRLQGFEPRAN